MKNPTVKMRPCICPEPRDGAPVLHRVAMDEGNERGNGYRTNRLRCLDCNRTWRRHTIADAA